MLLLLDSAAGAGVSSFERKQHGSQQVLTTGVNVARPRAAEVS
jgi:hypothetical protein